jgi:hypothetical protein
MMAILSLRVVSNGTFTYDTYTNPCIGMRHCNTNTTLMGDTEIQIETFETLTEFVTGAHVSRPHYSSDLYLPFGPLMSGRWISCYSFLKISPWSTSDRPRTTGIYYQGS